VLAPLLRHAFYRRVGDTDDLSYDAARKRLYVTGGEGYVDTLQQTDTDHLTRIARLASAAGARNTYRTKGVCTGLSRSEAHRKSEIRIDETHD